jgi:hypothetical protein
LRFKSEIDFPLRVRVVTRDASWSLVHPQGKMVQTRQTRPGFPTAANAPRIIGYLPAFRPLIARYDQIASTRYDQIASRRLEKGYIAVHFPINSHKSLPQSDLQQDNSPVCPVINPFRLNHSVQYATLLPRGESSLPTQLIHNLVARNRLPLPGQRWSRIHFADFFTTPVFNATINPQMPYAKNHRLIHQPPRSFSRLAI